MKRLSSVGRKLSGMLLALAFTSLIPWHVCQGNVNIHLPTPSHPQALKESLRSLHPAPPKQEALMPPLLLPESLTVLAIVFCCSYEVVNTQSPMLLQDI